MIENIIIGIIVLSAFVYLIVISVQSFNNKKQKKISLQSEKKGKMAEPGLPKPENQSAKLDKALIDNEINKVQPKCNVKIKVQIQNQSANPKPKCKVQTNVQNENQSASGLLGEEKNHPDLEIPSHPSTEGN